MAASAAVPGLIGPLVIHTKEYEWSAFQTSGELAPVAPRTNRYELWDGGVYDNLGLEPLYKPTEGLRSGIDFVIVSDASAKVEFSPRTLKRALKPAHRMLRLMDIATDQVRGMRARSIVAEFTRNSVGGVYLRMGKTSGDIYADANQEAPAFDFMGEAEVKDTASMKTTLRRLKLEEYDALLHHGFEVTDATLCSRHPNQFLPMKFSFCQPNDH